MRSILIKNINKITPLPDLYYSLKKLTNEIKKVFYADDLSAPGLNQGMCIVEYESHIYAKNALKILNSLNFSNNYFTIICDKKSLQAYWAEPFLDNIRELFSANTPFFFFENLNINSYNVFHFKLFLEKYLNENIVIKKIRQYTQKVLIEFDTCIKLTGPIYYNGRVVNIIPAMRPNSNIHRYKDKLHKIIPFYLSEEDRKLLVSFFDESYVDVMRKKAEIALNKISLENNPYLGFKKERDDDRKKYIEKRRDRDDKFVEKKIKRQPEEFRKTIFRKDSRDHRDVKDMKEHKKEIKFDQEVVAPQNNLVSQLASLFMNQGVSQGINALSGLASLNTLLTNPTLLTTIQQLSSISSKPQQNSNTNINPVYNIKPQDNQIPQQIPFKNYYSNQAYQFQNEIYMPTPYIEPQQNEMDQQIQMMRKYYEYMQSMNKNNP